MLTGVNRALLWHSNLILKRNQVGPTVAEESLELSTGSWSGGGPAWEVAAPALGLHVRCVWREAQASGRAHRGLMQAGSYAS